jgi:hypothetical protein
LITTPLIGHTSHCTKQWEQHLNTGQAPIHEVGKDKDEQDIMRPRLDQIVAIHFSDMADEAAFEIQVIREAIKKRKEQKFDDAVQQRFGSVGFTTRHQK